MKTGILKFNLNDRGRELTGVPRRYEAAQVAEIINSDYVQERVRNRDLRGYLGHWLRAKFGMNPPEAGIDKASGKLVMLEPAFITTYLKADADGNVEHESEVLDTVPGKTVQQYIANKVGGFSQAIWGAVKPGVDIAKAFHGFDYVSEPNYTFNRTYEMLFDSAADAEAEDELGMTAIFDSVMQEMGSALDHQQRLYASLNGDHLRALELIERLTIENNDIIGRAAAGQALFDSAAPFERPQRGLRAEDVLARMTSFKSQNLAALDVIKDTKAASGLRATRERVRNSL